MQNNVSSGSNPLHVGDANRHLDLLTELHVQLPPLFLVCKHGTAAAPAVAVSLILLRKYADKVCTLTVHTLAIDLQEVQTAEDGPVLETQTKKTMCAAGEAGQDTTANTRKVCHSQNTAELQNFVSGLSMQIQRT